MPTPILILRLEGVLQSWGERARWDFRDSNTMPTKSGVIGLLACAMGLPRGSGRIVGLSGEITMGVRADKNGIMLEDFHTVTGERNFLFSAEGKKRVGGATILTPRQYLQDACFTVALLAQRQTLEECVSALNNPVWPVFLGRKSCVPSRPVLEKLTEEFSSVIEALSRYPVREKPNKKAHEDTRKKVYLCEIEDTNGTILKRDEIAINTARNYGYRRVNTAAVEI